MYQFKGYTLAIICVVIILITLGVGRHLMRAQLEQQDLVESENPEKKEDTQMIVSKINVSPNERIERTIKVGSLSRTYTIQAPRKLLGAAQKHDVVFVYHPALSTGSFMEEKAPFHIAAGLENFVTIYPNGYGKTFNTGGCCGVAFQKEVDDIAFFKAMLEDIKGLIPIKEKVYLTGFSNGAFMTYKLVCDVPEKIAAAVPFAAAIDMTTCKNGSVPVLHLNGAEDEVSLYGDFGDSGSSEVSNAMKVMVTPYVALAPIARRNGCSSEHKPKDMSVYDASCEVYDACTSGHSVIMCVIPGLGHAWPGSGDDAVTSGRKTMFKGNDLGPYRPELDPTKPIVDFFLANPVE